LRDGLWGNPAFTRKNKNFNQTTSYLVEDLNLGPPAKQARVKDTQPRHSCSRSHNFMKVLLVEKSDLKAVPSGWKDNSARPLLLTSALFFLVCYTRKPHPYGSTFRSVRKLPQSDY